MSEGEKKTAKGKNFKQVIQQEKTKGKFRRKLMKLLTRINTSAMYGGSFLLLFIALDAALYYVLSPSVMVWAVILVGAAAVSTLFASHVTDALKKRQWKYASE